MNNPIVSIAIKEWRDAIRNRWLIGITLIFALMAIGISWFGGVASGQASIPPLDATMASLASLAVLVLPLIALLMGYDSFVGEQEQGTLLLLLSYPIARYQLVVGKFVGQALVLSLATLLGFGSAAIALSWFTEIENLRQHFSQFILSAMILGWVFIALSHVISLVSKNKGRAIALAIMTWFLFTLVYDLALMAILISSEGSLTQGSLTWLLSSNPTDAFRMINLFSFEGAGTGLLSSLNRSGLSVVQLYLSLGVWLAILLTTSTLIFNKKSI